MLACVIVQSTGDSECSGRWIPVVAYSVYAILPRHQGRPLRTLFAFDPGRTAILLIGGDKTGDKRFYSRLIPLADQLYDEHLEELKRKGEI